MPDTITIDEYRAATKQHKYGAKREEVDGVWFQSKKEAARYRELKIMERCGFIKNLTLQPRFALIVNNFRICEYLGDFSYIDLRKGEPVVEDVKGMKTQLYIVKKKLFEAIYGRSITET